MKASHTISKLIVAIVTTRPKLVSLTFDLRVVPKCGGSTGKDGKQKSNIIREGEKSHEPDSFFLLGVYGLTIVDSLSIIVIDIAIHSCKPTEVYQIAFSTVGIGKSGRGGLSGHSLMSDA